MDRPTVFFNQGLGLEPGDDPHSVVLETRPEHQVMPGTIHFAVLTTLAEVSAAQSVGNPVVPASIQVTLLRRASPGRLVGRGRLLKRGRRLAFCEGEVWSGDQLVAKASVQFAIVG